MKIFISALLIFLIQPLNAQYYYKDIITTQETTRQFVILKTNKVQSVKATGYDTKGVADPHFSEVQQMLDGKNALMISTKNEFTSPSYMIQEFDSNNRLIRLTDSATDFKSTTNYRYDNAGKIAEMKNISKDSSSPINNIEIHKWIYNVSGNPVKMLRIINSTDTLEVKFTVDKNGNVLDEQPFKHGKAGEITYYYYDDNNRLTDIVRFNKKIGKLMPDYLFEYNENNQVIQKITMLSNFNMGYLIWRYAFNEKGIKTKEALFNKDKIMTGKIEYQYTFTQ